MKKEQEGPIAGLRPAIFYKSCSGCKWYSYNLVKSGRDPIYSDNCKHETAPRAHFGCGNLTTDYETNIVVPGDWCPFDAVNVNTNP
jgi:hypothetical protein